MAVVAALTMTPHILQAYAEVTPNSMFLDKMPEGP
jgi:hypothetical protein